VLLAITAGLIGTWLAYLRNLLWRLSPQPHRAPDRGSTTRPPGAGARVHGLHDRGSAVQPGLDSHRADRVPPGRASKDWEDQAAPRRRRRDSDPHSWLPRWRWR
jgi:hypothetical protein